MKIKTMLKDKLGFTIQVFTPTKGATLVSPYQPADDIVVTLAAIADITIDGVEVQYAAGTVLGLSKKITYIFAADVLVHKM